MLGNILIYKIQQIFSRKKPSKILYKFFKMVQVVESEEIICWNKKGLFKTS